MKPIIDKVLNLAISKKLTVLVIGTIFAYLGKISGEQWINLSMIYIGSQSVIDAIIKLRNNK